MILYVNAKTSVKDLLIESIEVKLSDGRNVLLTWDESDISRDEESFSARYKGVYIDDSYANGKINELKDMKIIEVTLDTDFDMKENDFSITEIIIWDDGEKLFFNNVFWFKKKQLDVPVVFCFLIKSNILFFD